MKFRNVSIKKRIFLSNISMLLVPILIISIASPFFFNFIEKYLNLDTVTTNEYSAVSQIQWNVSLSQISGELIKNGFSENNKQLMKNIQSLEKNKTKVLINKNGENTYVTSGITPEKIISKSNEISGEYVFGKDIFHCGDAGLVISSAYTSGDTTYTILMINEDFLTDMSSLANTTTFGETSKFFAGKFGIIVLAIIGVFAFSIILLTVITSDGISKPLNMLKKGTKELTNGNYDYEIDYESKNEIGQLVDDFNVMRLKLKDTIDKKEKLEKQRKEMIAGFSHDLRTPLTSIKGYVEGLLDGIAKTPEKQNEYLKTIYSTTTDMENLVSELFLFSKLDVDKVTLDKENITIVNYLSDCCEEEKIELEKKNMDIDFSYSCDIMTVVSIDTAKFSRVILNIISNSVKYRKPDVKGHIYINLSKNNKFVLIDISDNGIGIDDESVRHVFETFYRADPSRTKVREGSGLGLSICKQIIELHDGKIWATGKLGEGMTVHIALPIPEIKE